MTTTTDPITKRLKDDNWDLHQIAERGGTPSSMIKGTISREGYVSSLEQGWLVHEALDSAVRAARGAEPLVAEVVAEAHAFEPWYREDLAYFGGSTGAEPTPGTARFIAHIEAHKDDPMHILGLHYVRLGATNGNRFVARKLRQVFGMESATEGMMALDPFGEAQRGEWMKFKETLDALPLDGAQRDALFEGTRAAYVLTINLDLEDAMSADELLEAHGKTLDRDAFEKGHSVHVN